MLKEVGILSDKKAIIQIKNLSKTYKSKNNDVNALTDINIDIVEGEIFGIIGLSGAGKSTLVRCINLLEKPTSGSIIFDNKNLTKMSEKELRKSRQSMAMIFQQFNLLMQRTALNNICFPLEIAGVSRSEAVKRAKELLKIVGLEDKENSYPSQLSGGQKQRIAIARALSTNPKVLLCDEATSALDPTTTRGVLSLLKDINKRLNITVVIITHEMAVIEEVCHRVAIIDNSKIAEIGFVEDIFTAPKSEIARHLVYPEGEKKNFDYKAECIRIVFDGRTSFEPVIANMILDCKEVINIMAANTKDIDGKAFGQMVIQLPNDKKASSKIKTYLKSRNVIFEEVL